MKVRSTSKTLQRSGILVLTVALLIAALVFYQKKVRYNLVTISENKVYNSGVIPPDKIPEVLQEYKIRTVIDLRDGEVQTELNPETKQQINREQHVVDALPGVRYFHLPTDQLPADTTVERFLRIMDDQKNYPVLIHCHHGVGRSRLFSSIYRIEFENFSNEKARENARYLWELSGNFAKNSDKGKYLLNYKKRLNDGF